MSFGTTKQSTFESNRSTHRHAFADFNSAFISKYQPVSATDCTADYPTERTTVNSTNFESNNKPFASTNQSAFAYADVKSNQVSNRTTDYSAINTTN
eukprot:gene29747-33520_t